MFSEWKCRCSKLGDLHTSGKTKEKTFGDTAYSFLDSEFAKNKYGIETPVFSKYFSKGIEQEEESITLKSSIDGVFYTKNTERKENSFIVGECDIVSNDSIIDIKSTFDMITFLKKKREKLDKSYMLQLTGYGELWCKQNLDLTYCLVNATYDELERQRKQLYFQLGCPNEESNKWINEQLKLERRLIYDSDLFLKTNRFADLKTQERIFIPENERVFSIKFDFDSDIIHETKFRVARAREILNEML